jgi:hypothetical protein
MKRRRVERRPLNETPRTTTEMGTPPSPRAAASTLSGAHPAASKESLRQSNLRGRSPDSIAAASAPPYSPQNPEAPATRPGPLTPQPATQIPTAAPTAHWAGGRGASRAPEAATIDVTAAQPTGDNNLGLRVESGDFRINLHQAYDNTMHQNRPSEPHGRGLLLHGHLRLPFERLA